jgi:hypothetical protein
MAEKVKRDWEQSKDWGSLHRAGRKDMEGRRWRRTGCCETKKERRRNS